MIPGFLNLPWFAWAGLALLVAILYSFFWPKKALTAKTGLRHFIVRWGHALAWILLTANFLLRGLSPSLNRAADALALAGGAVYLVFLAATFVTKKA